MLLDLAIVLDASGSVGHDAWNNIRLGFASMLSHLQIGPANVRVALVTFSSLARVEFNLNTYTSIDEITKALLGAPYMGQTTNAASALRALSDEVFTDKNGDRPEANNVVIFVTDGQSTIDSDQIQTYSQLLELKAVRRMVIGVTSEVNLEELELIASSGWILSFPSFHVLDMAVVMDSLLMQSSWCSGE